MKEAEDCLNTFPWIITAEEYIHQQIFNCDVTGHFCQIMLRRNNITVAQIGYLYKWDEENVENVAEIFRLYSNETLGKILHLCIRRHHLMTLDKLISETFWKGGCNTSLDRIFPPENPCKWKWRKRVWEEENRRIRFSY